MESAAASSSTNNELPVVLVTGASGYVALHCVRRLLESPYRVRGTVRSLRNKQKVDPLWRLPGATERLELVEADLLKEEGWDKAVADCSFILHVASPWVIVADESVVETALTGTLTVLRAAARCPSVRKVVLTSSCAAVNDGHKNKSRVFDETCWTNLQSKKVEHYGRSKALAERAAWDFWNALDHSTRFQLTVLNPTLVFGPVLSDVDHGCAQILARIMDWKTSLAQPKASLGLVDVRDVADAHVVALERPQTDGERILITATPSAWYVDIARWLKAEFAQFGYSITTLEATNPLLRLYAASGIDPQARQVVNRIGGELRFDNSKSIRLLNMQYRPIDAAVVDMAHSMIDFGMVRATKKYRARFDANINNGTNARQPRRSAVVSPYGKR